MVILVMVTACSEDDDNGEGGDTRNGCGERTGAYWKEWMDDWMHGWMDVLREISRDVIWLPTVDCG